ncbi:hypothetical protein J4216_02925 [Candidatus Woesearchaeota archaeon]|nr:hypothetical protein [Candidatus Woesearchaeota archaeon]
MKNKNKKGISPLIATVLVIGFTIVLAALVITWGTKLFRTTVDDTASASKFNLACTTGFKIDTEVVRDPSTLSGGTVPNPAVPDTLAIRIKNRNQDQEVSGFRFILYEGNEIANIRDLQAIDPNSQNSFSVWDGANNQWSADTNLAKLQFPVPSIYGVVGIVNRALGVTAGVNATNASKVEIYPQFTIDGESKYCEDPIELKIRP